MQVNKLVWPAQLGIGVHIEESMLMTEAAALAAGVINKTVSAWFHNQLLKKALTALLFLLAALSESWHNARLPGSNKLTGQPAGSALQVPFEEHTTDNYVRTANRLLVEEGLDVEGLYFDQAQYQVGYVGYALCIGVWLPCQGVHQGAALPLYWHAPLLLTACPCAVTDVHLQVTLAFCLNADGVADICPDAPVDEYEPPIEDPTEVRLAHSAVSGLVLRVPIGLLDV